MNRTQSFDVLLASFVVNRFPVPMKLRTAYLIVSVLCVQWLCGSLPFTAFIEELYDIQAQLLNEDDPLIPRPFTISEN